MTAHPDDAAALEAVEFVLADGRGAGADGVPRVGRATRKKAQEVLSILRAAGWRSPGEVAARDAENRDARMKRGAVELAHRLAMLDGGGLRGPEAHWRNLPDAARADCMTLAGAVLAAADGAPPPGAGQDGEVRDGQSEGTR